MSNQNNFYTQQQNNSNSNQQQNEDNKLLNYASEDQGAVIHHFTSQALNGPCSSILNSNRRHIWLSEEGMPQSFIVDISNLNNRPKFFKCIGFDAWHDYSSNPKILEISVSVDETNFITWITLNAELKEGVQVFPMDPLGRRYNFIKVEIKETFGASKTYLNQLILLEEYPYIKLNQQSIISQHSSDQNMKLIQQLQQNQGNVNMEQNQNAQHFLSNQESPTYQNKNQMFNNKIDSKNLNIEQFPSAQESPRGNDRNISSDSKSQQNASDPTQSNQKNYNYPRQLDQHQFPPQQILFSNQDDFQNDQFQQQQQIQQSQQQIPYSQEKYQSKQKKSIQQFINSQEKPYHNQHLQKNLNQQYQQLQQQQGGVSNSMQFTNRMFDQSVNSNNNPQQSKQNLLNLLQNQNQQQYSDLKSMSNTPQYSNLNYQNPNQQQQQHMQSINQQYSNDNNSVPVSENQKTQIQLLQHLEDSLRISNYKDELRKQYESELKKLRNELFIQQEKIQLQIQAEVNNLKQSVSLTEQQQLQTTQNVKTLESVMEKMQENVCIVIDKIKDLQEGVSSVKDDIFKAKSPFQSPQSNSNQFNSTTAGQTLHQMSTQLNQQQQFQNQNQHQTISFNNTQQSALSGNQNLNNNNFINQNQNNQNQYELFPQSKKASVEQIQNNFQSVGNTFQSDQQSPTNKQQQYNQEYIQQKIDFAIDNKFQKFEQLIQQTMSSCLHNMESKIKDKLQSEMSRSQKLEKQDKITKRHKKSQQREQKENNYIFNEFDHQITDDRTPQRNKNKLNKKKSQRNVTNTKVLGLLNILQKKLEERQSKIEQLNSEEKKTKKLQKKLQSELGYAESSSASYIQ